MSLGVMQSAHLLGRKSKAGIKHSKGQGWHLKPCPPGALQFIGGGSLIFNFTDPAQGCKWLCALPWNATAPFLCIKHKWDTGKEKQKLKGWKGPCILNGFWNALNKTRYKLIPTMELHKKSVSLEICTPNWTPIIPNYIAYSEHLVLQHGLWCISIIQETPQAISSLPSVLVKVF